MRVRVRVRVRVCVWCMFDISLICQDVSLISICADAPLALLYSVLAYTLECTMQAVKCCVKGTFTDLSWGP